MSGYQWNVDEWLLTTTLVLLLGGLLALVIVRMAHAAGTHPRAGYTRHLLDVQFARGELSIEEYERRRGLIERF